MAQTTHIVDATSHNKLISNIKIIIEVKLMLEYVRPRIGLYTKSRHKIISKFTSTCSTWLKLVFIPGSTLLSSVVLP